MSKINKKEEDWKKQLNDEEYKVLREKGTESPWTGALLENKEKGTYECAACGNVLLVVMICIRQKQNLILDPDGLVFMIQSQKVL
jgi:hypothetical protein